MDRVIQQGIAQVISPMCEPLFSDGSYGFCPNRSCEMAVREMLVFLNEGYEWIVDIDLEKFKRTLKGADKQKAVNGICGKGAEAKLGNQRVDKLLCIGSMKAAMNDIDAHLRTRLRVIIWKQWKVPKKRQWGLQKLGIGKDLARVTAYCGDRYQWVVTKTCVVRAISKEKLSQAGLVSCYDYYLERHALKLC